MTNLLSDKVNNLINAGHAVDNDYDPHESIIKILENQTVYMKSDMSADADGSPRATVIDTDGQNETSLQKTNGWHGKGDYVNAEKIPYFVLPGNFKKVTNVSCKLGDLALVRYNGREVFAIYADSGPSKLLGEGSIKLIESLCGNPWNKAKTKIISGIGFGVEYLVFPRSSETFGIPTTFEDIQSVGQKVFDAKFGGSNTMEADNNNQTQTNADVFLKLAKTVGQEVPAKSLHTFKNNKHPEGNPRYWGIVDFNQHSAKKRFYLFDTKEETVKQYLVSHGKGSDTNRDGMADKFSNLKGSNCSSLGIYRCDKTYEGGHGLSLLLDGLEKSNSKVRERFIVMHKADYVSQDFINKNNGVIGRSEGCFAVENSVIDNLINELKNGSYIIAWKK